MEIFNKELVLHDKNWNRNKLTINNERWYFSICNTNGQNRFEPKNELQQKLLDIWDTYHLNGMSAGTKEQDEELKKVWLNVTDYDKACEYLKSIWLYEVDYKWEKYKYWSWFIYKDFPDNFEEDLFNLIDQLQEEEDEYNDKLITIDDLSNEQFIEHADDNCDWEVEKLMAACLECWVSFNWLENVTSSNGVDWEIEWQYYFIYTDEEADEAHLRDIESVVDDMWFDWFNKDYLCWPYVTRLENGNIEVSISIEIWDDERWNSLARYDWQERYQEVNWTYYYLYKC